MTTTTRLLLAALLSPVLAGCAEVGPGAADQRYPVRVTLTVDGQPLDNGTVELIPLNARAPTSAPIKSGIATLDAVAGQLRVEVRQLRALPGMPEPVNVLPVRYNESSELTAEVTAEGPNEFVFALKSH